MYLFFLKDNRGGGGGGGGAGASCPHKKKNKKYLGPPRKLGNIRKVSKIHGPPPPPPLRTTPRQNQSQSQIPREPLQPPARKTASMKALHEERSSKIYTHYAHTQRNTHQ